MTYLAALGMHICVYIFCYNQTPPKRGSYCHPLQPPDSLSVFSEQCWARAVRELLFRTYRNAFAPPRPRHWLSGAAKPRPPAYKYAMRSWNASYPVGSPRTGARRTIEILCVLGVLCLSKDMCVIARRRSVIDICSTCFK